MDDTIDWSELEQELDSSNPVHIVSYQSPLDQTIFEPREDDRAAAYSPPPAARHPKSAEYHRVWVAADRLIDRHEMWPDAPEVDAVLAALAHAPIVDVDLLDIGEYESGTADKWIVTLDGGQRAVMKIVRSVPSFLNVSIRQWSGADMELGHWVTGSMGHLGRLSRPGYRVIILTRRETRVFPVFEKSSKIRSTVIEILTFNK